MCNGGEQTRKVEVLDGNLTLSDQVEQIYEKIVTPFGTSAKIDCQKKFIGRRVYVLVLKD